MTELQLDPQNAYETLAEALHIFREQQEQPPVHAITDLRNAVARAAEVWRGCEPLRATRDKEFRSHLVKLKLLLAGAYQTLEAFNEAHLPQAA